MAGQQDQAEDVKAREVVESELHHARRHNLHRLQIRAARPEAEAVAAVALRAADHRGAADSQFRHRHNQHLRRVRHQALLHLPMKAAVETQADAAAVGRTLITEGR